jgi:hypothetical protein
MTHRSKFAATAATLTTVALAACSTDPISPSSAARTAPNFTIGGVSGAAFTTTNPNVDRANGIDGGSPTLCFNGQDKQEGTNNCNAYAAKAYVWLNGGPAAGGLETGEYFWVVVAPGGQPTVADGSAKNLSDGVDPYTNRRFHWNKATGVATLLPNIDAFAEHDLDPVTNRIRVGLASQYFENTPNPGGVYILGICALTDEGDQIDPSKCKYDAFKVRSGGGTDTPSGDPVISGTKYYDANENGQWDAGEAGIAGWPITYTGLFGDGGASATRTIPTDANGDFAVSATAASGLRGVALLFDERRANAPWYQTGNTADQTDNNINTLVLSTLSLASPFYTYTVTPQIDGATAGSTSGLYFGNVCRLVPGGRTIGFWSNKNGLALLTDANFTQLTSYFLRNGNGTNRDFTASLANNRTAYSSWLLNANATNMAYMLSAQMSATYLNTVTNVPGVLPAKTISNELILVDNREADAALKQGNGGLIPDDVFATIVPAPRNVAQELAYADILLRYYPSTTAAGAARAEQERVKNIFDKINNNGSLGGFTQPTQATCPAPVFP